MAVSRVPNAGRYGTVQVDSHGLVAGFAEKTGGVTSGLVNGGVYVFGYAVLAEMPDGTVSLERDVFSRLIERGVYAMEQRGMFIDIGTPGDYIRAQMICDRLSGAVFD